MTKPKEADAPIHALHHFLSELVASAPVDSDILLTHFKEDPNDSQGWGVKVRVHVGSLINEETGFDYLANLVGCADHNWYVSLGVFTHADATAKKAWKKYKVENKKSHPKAGRTLASAKGVLGVVIDDCNFDGLPAPSVVVQTSPNSEQHMYFFKEMMEVVAANGMVKRLSGGVINQTGGDKSGNNAIRWVRPPYGKNTKAKYNTGSGAPTVSLIETEGDEAMIDYAPVELEQKLNKAAGHSPNQPLIENPIVGLLEPLMGDRTDAARFDPQAAMKAILSADSYHGPLTSLAGYFIKSGTTRDAAVLILQSLMELVKGETDRARWLERYNDIERTVDYCVKGDKPADVLGEIKPMDTKHLMANKPADPPELIQGVIPYSVFGLVGTGGVAKSTFALYVSICLASGHEVLECRQPPIGVLYLSGEDEESQILPRLYDLIDALDLNEEEQENLNKNFHFKDLTGAMVRLVETDSSNNIVITAFTDQLIEAYQPHNIKLLWVDPTGFFGAGERLVNDGEMALMQAGRRISKGLGGAAVGFIHHVSKEAARNKFTDQHAGRGGSAFADNSRAMLVMNLYTGKDKDGDKPPIALIENDPNIVEDLRLVQLNVAKYSYGMRNPRPYWITRSAINPFDLNIITPPSGAEARKIAAEHRKADQAKKVEDKKLDVIALLYLIEKRIAEHLPVTKTQLEKCDEVEIHKSISRANLRSAYERAESKGLILKIGGGSNTKITLHENWRGMAGCALEPLLWAAENSKNASLYPATPPYPLNNTSGGGVGRG
jgi:RecA-family ATPase